MEVGMFMIYQGDGHGLNNEEMVRAETELAVRAEGWGFDSVWVPEHYTHNAYSISGDPTQLLTYIAAKTSRIKLGTAGIILPWLELILGVFLIFGVFLEGSTSLTIGLYIFFIFILSQAVFRGIDVHCGCFKTEADAGVADLKMGLIKRIGEDILLLGMAFIYKMKNKITISNKDHE